MTQVRAKKGGEFGANGEWYEGGKFINTNPVYSKSHKPSRSTGKQEVAPYVWEVAPAGMVSLYRQFAGVFGKVVNGTAILTCSDQTLAYYRQTRESIQAMIDRWNSGERWV